MKKITTKKLTLQEEFEKDIYGLITYARTSEARRVTNKWQKYIVKKESTLEAENTKTCIHTTKKGIQCKRKPTYCGIHKPRKIYKSLKGKTNGK